jgi:NAD(P)-dependent dehydrogenase (short-subunit alcohol dehydrogenase family)
LPLATPTAGDRPRYDGAYVALAELVGARLVTLDARLARAPGPTCEMPLGRIGAPEDVAVMVAFLASGLARQITGSDLGVDGGQIATI